MENQSTKTLDAKTKKNRRKKRYRRNRSRSNKSSGCSRGFNASNQYGASLGITNSFIMPPLSDWFWKTYRHVMDWQGRHQVAYWKSRAQAVECQNSMLMDYVERMNTDVTDLDNEDEGEDLFSDAPIQETDNEEEQDIEEETDGESLVFEVNEEMLDFFQQSIKHKQEMKALREAEMSQRALNHENESIDIPIANIGMVGGTLLYGKNAPAILAMETSMQLTFERFVEKAKPQLWPNIPLNL